MRIQDPYTEASRPTRPEMPAVAAPAVASRRESAADAATTVKLSARARELSDNSRIAALKEKVQNGTLPIDAQAIARALVGADA